MSKYRAQVSFERMNLIGYKMYHNHGSMTSRRCTNSCEVFIIVHVVYNVAN